MEPRPIGGTKVTVLRRMMPTDANPAGNVYGGSIMKIVDEVGGVVAHRHARTNVVTARMHTMDFHEAVLMGDLLILDGALVLTGRSSMMVRIEIHAENLDTGERTHTGTAWLTLVALNERGKPIPVPPVAPETAEERRWHEEAKARRAFEAEAKQRLEGKTG